MAQLVQRLPRMQNVAGLSPAQGSSFSLGEKKELSLGNVAWICLVSITHYTCTCSYMYMHIYTAHTVAGGGSESELSVLRR